MERRRKKLIVPEGMPFPEVSADISGGMIIVDENLLLGLFSGNGINRAEVSCAQVNSILLEWYKLWIDSGGERKRSMDDILAAADIPLPA